MSEGDVRNRASLPGGEIPEDWVYPQLACGPIGDSDWMVEAEIVSDQGIAKIRQLRVVPLHGQRDGKLVLHGGTALGQPVPDDAYLGDGLTARVLRQVKLGPLLETVVRQRRPLIRVRYEDRTVQEMRSGLEGLPTRVPRRGVAVTDRELALWAARYADLVAAGSTTPIQDIARDPAVRYTATSISTLINRARRRGLLTKGRPGRAEGVLTAKGWRALGQPQGAGQKPD